MKRLWAACTVLLASAACAGWMPHPEPTVTSVFASDLGAAEADVEVLNERFRRLDGYAVASVVDPHHLRVDSVDVGPGEVTQLLHRNRVRLGTLTNHEIESASVVIPEYSGSAVLKIHLTEAGSTLLCEETAKSLGQPLPFVVDDDEVSSPIVRERICGDALVVEAGPYWTRNMQALSLRIGGPSLAGKWTLIAEDTFTEAPPDIPPDPMLTALPPGFERAEPPIEGDLNQDGHIDRVQLLVDVKNDKPAIGIFMGTDGGFDSGIVSGEMRLPSTSANPAIHIVDQTVVLTLQGREDVTRQYTIGRHPERGVYEVLSRSEVWFGLDEATMNIDYLGGTSRTTTVVDGEQTVHTGTFQTAPTPFTALSSAGLLGDPAPSTDP